jgi:hypothetical protein
MGSVVSLLNYAKNNLHFWLIVFRIRKKQRTRLQPIRTASEIQVKIVIEPIEQTPLYQKLASKIEELHLLGMSLRAIGKSLKVNRRTVVRALKHRHYG